MTSPEQPLDTTPQGRLIERWFKEITERRLRRGTFSNVPELEDAITTWSGHWHVDPKPFVWKANAADITEKVRRGRAAPQPPDQFDDRPLGHRDG